MEIQVVSLVILELSRQLGSDSCLLMTAVEILSFTTQIWSYGFEVNTKKSENVVEKPHRLSQSLHCFILVYSFNPRYSSFFSIEENVVSFQLKTFEENILVCRIDE